MKNLLDLLTKGHWVGIAAIATFIFGLASLFLPFMNQSVRKLQIDILSNSPLVSVNTDIAKEIRVLYQDKPVKDLSLILLKFENTGNEPIKESDYSEPICVAISQNAEIGEIVVQESRPEGIKLIPTVITNDQAELAKVLLNPGDQVILKILALNNDGTLDVKARIAGIRALDIQSSLADKNTSGNSTAVAPSNKFFVILIFTAFIGLADLIWDSDPVLQLRGIQHRAELHYNEANKKILNGFDRAVPDLKKALDYDNEYVQTKINDEFWFRPLKEKIDNDSSWPPILLNKKKKSSLKGKLKKIFNVLDGKTTEP